MAYPQETPSAKRASAVMERFILLSERLALPPGEGMVVDVKQCSSSRSAAAICSAFCRPQRWGRPANSVGPSGKSSVGSRSGAEVLPESSRKRSYPNPQAGGRRVHLAGPSPARAVLITSTLAGDWLSNRDQIIRSRGTKARRPELLRYRTNPEPQTNRAIPRDGNKL